MDKKKWALFALASIPLMMTLGNSMFIPVLPTIEKELNISPFQSSLVITVYSVVAIPLIPVAGYLSDKFGRKKVMIPSLIITGIGGGLAAFAAWKIDEPYIMILVGRFLQGIGAAGAFPVVIPTVGDLFKDKEEVTKGLGIIETSNTFGKVLSPILGSLLAFLIWYVPFIAVPILSAISILLLLLFVHAPKQEKKQEDLKHFVHKIKKVFHYNGHWLTATFLIGCLNMFVLFGFLFNLSEQLELRFEIESVMKGVLLAVPLLVLCTASFVTGKKVGKNQKVMKWFIFIGNAGSGIGLVFLRSNMTLVWTLILLAVAGLGIGISLPCLDALITEGIKKDIRGTITSLYSSMRFIGVALGPPIIAIMLKSLSTYIYLLLGGLSMIAAIITFLWIRPDSKTQSEKGMEKGVKSTT
ncbi:MFS transporter, ACDE family, multidrug resistance protein [Salinibacillus kushneri]|uniref:MFS transporter, ACDE family, multidrug resistance protein n=1 Tax=Salinibacillus kushneri TaxID=237682 RepID=A0A1I0I9B1_9BACI|nr:MFS transporter [Salinibacillus kushneri]SET93317.1 MFS transporter, ACDE family, multidrug resistance protein [Salinibacillus kushneri]